MTQEELAGELNVTRQALSNWERDVNEPDLNMLKKRKTKRRGKGMNMQNDTFNQILNSNLASMDPGFGQFALAKASSDLFKKVINK